MGRLLTAIDEQPDLVISSTAVRAATTAELASAAGGWSAPVRLTDALYGAYPDAVIQLLAGVPDEVSSLMIVGHQPTWGGVVQRLTGAGAAIRTATVAIIDLYLGDSWNHDGHPTGELVALLQPRHFADLDLAPHDRTPT